MIFKLPEGEIDLDFDENVYSPVRTSVDTIVLANLLAKDGFTVVDVGCGSGYLGLSLKKLNPNLDVICADVDSGARFTTRNNAKSNLLNVKVLDSNLLEGIKKPVHMVIANLPTYNSDQMKSEKLHGPVVAYEAPGDGFDLIEDLLIQCMEKVKPGGYIVLECQERLQGKLQLACQTLGFHLITRTDYSFALVNPLR
jgi:methylase of polypeptide subunit release factors